MVAFQTLQSSNTDGWSNLLTQTRVLWRPRCCWKRRDRPLLVGNSQPVSTVQSSGEASPTRSAPLAVGLRCCYCPTNMWSTCRHPNSEFSLSVVEFYRIWMDCFRFHWFSYHFMVFIGIYKIALAFPTIWSFFRPIGFTVFFSRIWQRLNGFFSGFYFDWNDPFCPSKSL